MSESLYDVLGISSSADQKEIRKAYLKLSLRYHPDKNTDNPEAAKTQFIRIGQAYEILSDPIRRSEYDRSRRNGYRRPTHSSQPRPQPSAPSYEHDDRYYHCSSAFPEQESYYYEYSSSSSTGGGTYESYRQAFDATMAGMSEEELRDVMGAASMIGGIVGGILGSRMMGNNSSPLMRNMGSVVGGMLASGAASALVETAHGQARERIGLEQERRERMARGETPPSVERGADQMWKDVLQATADVVLQKTVAAMFQGGRR